ncbi:hypothetical protein XBKB1_700041 [Xenorhabdus bovienii str. kraussei Becker Underwood]|uniref:Uncharacterized protein n=1 Tax=Xenorhabdus bovienii str. kraussei Becker Underwood TaxID=1398204 RepID=A0A077Q0I6_XENBV|nr:hypothetical protein XBKB1_700041 [Xenorhabdus bovienii str. kraussei Becker Underwood]
MLSSPSTVRRSHHTPFGTVRQTNNNNIPAGKALTVDANKGMLGGNISVATRQYRYCPIR